MLLLFLLFYIYPFLLFVLLSDCVSTYVGLVIRVALVDLLYQQNGKSPRLLFLILVWFVLYWILQHFVLDFATLCARIKEFILAGSLVAQKSLLPGGECAWFTLFVKCRFHPCGVCGLNNFILSGPLRPKSRFHPGGVCACFILFYKSRFHPCGVCTF